MCLYFLVRENEHNIIKFNFVHSIIWIKRTSNHEIKNGSNDNGSTRGVLEQQGSPPRQGFCGVLPNCNSQFFGHSRMYHCNLRLYINGERSICYYVKLCRLTWWEYEKIWIDNFDEKYSVKYLKFVLKSNWCP